MATKKFRKWVDGVVNGAGYSPGVTPDAPFNVSFQTRDEGRPGYVSMDAASAIDVGLRLLGQVAQHAPEALTVWADKHGPLRVSHQPTGRWLRFPIEFEVPGDGAPAPRETG